MLTESVDDLVARQATLIGGILAPRIAHGRGCALLDFPNHNNVGDNAIWLGEKALLTQLGARVVYQADLSTYSESALKSAVGDGLILLHGGGNLGDYWPVHEAFREHVVSSFRDNPIIQLPQTVSFRSPQAAERASAALRSHPNLLVLVRDHKSLAVARNDLGVRAELCPDMAFMLGTRPQPVAPAVDVLWLARTDHEARFGPPLPRDNLLIADWFSGDPSRTWSRLLPPVTVRARRFVSRLFRRSRTLRDALGPHIASATFDRLAQSRFSRGLRVLSYGRVVITDRLHGHILCLLMGKPHVVLDNAYGKLSSYAEAFSTRGPMTVWATDPEDAYLGALGLLRAGETGRANSGTCERE